MTKRLLDFLIALLAIILLFPILLLVTLILYFANKGAGVFFTQERPGNNAKNFKIIKFKTMTDERDSEGKLLPDAQRLTKVGKFVRSTSIDELPQLFNVIIGSMSLIGPRPLLPRYIELYNKRQARRHEVRPGITGWAQVNGRNNILWKDKLELDIFYVENMSFLLDIQIIWMTIIKVFKRDGITAEESVSGIPFTGNN